jgi:hypothetical protein
MGTRLHCATHACTGGIRKGFTNGGQIDKLLGSCWEEILDPGPYVFGEGGKVDWGKVLQGDRFFALLVVRALT